MNSSPTSPSSLSHILNPVDIPAYMEHLNPSAVSPTERQPAFTIRTSSSPSSTSGVVPDYIRDSIWSPPIAASTSKGYNMAGPSYQRQTPMHISPRHSFSPRRTSLSLDCASDPYRSYGSSPISPVSDVRTGEYGFYQPLSAQSVSSSREPELDTAELRESRASSEWQASERASVRLATAPRTSYSQYYPDFKPDFKRWTYSEPNGRQISPTVRSHSTDRTRPRQRSSEKRGVSEVEHMEEPPKSKRKFATKSRERPGPSKRGHKSKARSEAIGIAPLNESAPKFMYIMAARQPKGNENEAPYHTVPVPFPAEVNLRTEPQASRCMANRYNLGDDITRCVSCIRRWAGDTCRFQNLRSFYRDSTGKIVGLGFREEHKARDAPRLEFPNAWNTPIRAYHIDKTKKIIAAALLPTLREELKHLGQAGLVYRPRESDVRATCDTCLTSIFSCSWMCRLCGREACAECFEQVKKLTIEPADASEEELTDLHALRDKHAHANPAFLVCMKKKDHSAQHFLPMSRFSKIELSEVINAMEALSRVTGMPLPDVSVEDAAEHSLQSKPSNGDGAQTPLDAAPSPISNDSDVTMICDGDSPSHPDVVPVASETNPEIPAHEIQRFRDSDLTEEIFRPLWAQGNPLLITDVGRKLKIDWSPEYFMKKYGTESCLIIECQSEINKRITVAEFFSDFGNYDGRENCWKLKDWPPSSDFKTSFPELYEDFSQAVPMPSYVRRDGALNIASHFPSNTVGPDLGPKMYNANANRVAGTKGSTRLHMDMADALNIMTYAAPDPEGKEGSAAWDLFRAQDSDQIRKFLRVKFAITALDPIHSQQVYLDDDSRRELWEKHGVKSYRVYQKAGEAVFIPAGCAHQVRNLSDCIKVAIDFVSPENIARCEKLTREFREQNHTKAWKEDVLQLRTMMWFAWLSCCRQERLAAS